MLLGKMASAAATWFVVALMASSAMTKSVPVTVSSIEKVLEKLGARVSDNEYVTVIKKPIGDIPKTFVLLSRLYALSSGENGASPTLKVHRADEPIAFRVGFPQGSRSFPGGKIIFPQMEISSLSEDEAPTSVASSTTTTTTSSTTQAPTPTTSTTSQATSTTATSTIKPRVYNFYKVPVLAPSSSSTSEPTTTLKPAVGNPRTKGQLVEATMDKISFSGDTNLDPNAASDGADDENNNDDLGKNMPLVGFHTLVQVPTREKKGTYSVPCANGGLKDHHGRCRTPVSFARPASRPTYRLPTGYNTSTRPLALFERTFRASSSPSSLLVG